jgi:ABC-2 type transport system ATP-binding protein
VNTTPPPTSPSLRLLGSGCAAGDAEIAIEATGLTRTFAGGTGIVDLSFGLARGEVLALLGPNGAGKTTTIRLLNGVLHPDRGTARVLGFDPTVDGHELRRRTGVLTENAGLDDRLTARENLLFTALVRGMGRRDASRRIDDLLERFALTDRRDRPVFGASTGQRRRLALARALVHDPEVLFLDEPTSGLDPTATRDVIAMIDELSSQRGRTIVLCTHYLGEAGRLADRMAVVYEGHLHAIGRPEELAAALWPGLRVELDLDGRADESLAAALRASDGVLSVERSPSGLMLRVADRAVVPGLVSQLVTRGVAVFGATPQPETLEEVYFAIEAKLRPTPVEHVA